MTEMFLKCSIHNKKVHVKSFTFNEEFIAECGCKFIIYSYDNRNITEQEKRDSESHYVDDHKGKSYQDGSREFEGTMLQDGSYI